MGNMKTKSNRDKLVAFINNSSELECGVIVMDIVEKALSRLDKWDEYVEQWSPNSIIHPNYIRQTQIDRVKYLGSELDKTKLGV